MSDFFWTAIALILAGSLAADRLTLHLVGIACCTLLLYHAVELRDPAFITIQASCIIFNAVGLYRFCTGLPVPACADTCLRADTHRQTSDRRGTQTGGKTKNI